MFTAHRGVLMPRYLNYLNANGDDIYVIPIGVVMDMDATPADFANEAIRTATTLGRPIQLYLARTRLQEVDENTGPNALCLLIAQKIKAWGPRKPRVIGPAQVQTT